MNVRGRFFALPLETKGTLSIEPYVLCPTASTSGIRYAFYSFQIHITAPAVIVLTRSLGGLHAFLGGVRFLIGLRGLRRHRSGEAVHDVTKQVPLTKSQWHLRFTQHTSSETCIT